MEEYERIQKDKRLVELINNSDACSESHDIAAWLDCIPEIAELCIYLHEETKDDKYREILITVLTGIDDMLVDTLRRAPIEEKEKYNIVRLRLFRLMDKV